MGVIFDLDQTIIDSSIAEIERRNRNWNAVYSLIPQMQPYRGVVKLIRALMQSGIEVAVVTSSPRPYCQRVLEFLGITGVTTVCYHDTEKHKPDPEPILLAKQRMPNQEGKQIIAIGDDIKDVVAAQKAGVDSILGYWGNYQSYLNWDNSVKPSIFCRDEESLLRYFNAKGVNVDMAGLRKRNEHTYQLFDYYPISRTHDSLSEEMFNEMKGKNNSTKFCANFCKVFKHNIENTCGTFGIFVVPSSTAGNWNSKIMNNIIPYLVKMGLVDCSTYLLRYIAHEKQAYGGDRSVGSNLSTIRLQYELPSGLDGAYIIDDFTTTGNTFEACTQLLCNNGISRDNIYCLAIGGTI